MASSAAPPGPPQPEGRRSSPSADAAEHTRLDAGRYLDFEVEIAPGAGRDYPVAVTSSPAGEARETMTFPYDELALDSRLKSLRLALLRSGGPRRDLLSEEEDDVRTFGRAIFDALLVGRVRSLYETSYQLARAAGKGLRLKLRVHPPELACLPWEYVYDPHRGEYLSLSRDTPIVRFIEVGRPIEPLRVEPPLRILGMVAGPTNLPKLDTEREKHRVEQAVAPLQSRGLVELTWLEGQTWRDLQAAMRHGPWHIFHFVGHGDFDPTAGEGVVAFCDEVDQAHHLSATELGRLLADHHPLRLVLLNSCEGARASARDLFSSTAAVLVRRGLPAVLAMQDEITDRAAVELSRAFYEALADGYPVDAAVAEARKAVSLAVTNTLEWGTPVLFTRAPDGVIFDVPPARVDDRAGRAELDADRANRIDELYTEALSAYWVEDWDRASSRLDDLITLAPDHPGARSRLDEVHRRRHLADLRDRADTAAESSDWTTAIAALEEITDLAPDDATAQRDLSTARRHQRVAELFAEAQRLHDAGQWEAVTNVVVEIHDLDPDFTEAQPLADSAEEHLVELRRRQHLEKLYRQAVEDMSAGRWAEAGLALSEIQSAAPDFRDTPGLLARCQSQLSEEQARRDREAEGAELYDRAVAHLAGERWQEAADTMTAVLDLVPDHDDPRGVAGRAERALAAEKLAATAASLEPVGQIDDEPGSEVPGPELATEEPASGLHLSRLVLLGAMVALAVAVTVGVMVGLGGGGDDGAETAVGQDEVDDTSSEPSADEEEPAAAETSAEEAADAEGTGPAVPEIIAVFEGSLFDTSTWAPVGTGLAQSNGVVTIVDVPGGGPTGFAARTAIGVDRSADLEASLWIDPAQAPAEDNVQAGLQIGPIDLKCARNGVDAWCWHGNSLTGEHQELRAQIAVDEWTHFRIEVRPDESMLHYFVNGEHIGSLAIPDGAPGQTGHFSVLVHNQSGLPEVAGQVDEVTIGPGGG